MNQTEMLQDVLQRLVQDLDTTDFETEDEADRAARVELEVLGPNSVLMRVLGSAVGNYSHGMFDMIFNRMHLIACHLVLDLTECLRISSYALGLIAALAADRRDHHWEIYAYGANKQVAFAIHCLELERMIKERESLEQIREEMANIQQS